VFDLKHEAELDSAVQALAKELTALPAAQLAKIKDASAQTKSFTYADYKDILDLLDHAGTGSLAPRSTAAVRTAVSQYVVANDQNQDAMTHGLSIWMPTDASDVSTYLERYRGLKFNKATGWADVVAKAFGQ
jgi:hypothetical protein